MGGLYQPSINLNLRLFCLSLAFYHTYRSRRWHLYISFISASRECTPPSPKKKHTHKRETLKYCMDLILLVHVVWYVLLINLFLWCQGSKVSHRDHIVCRLQVFMYPPPPRANSHLPNSILSPSNQVIYGSMVVGGQIISLSYSYTTLQPRNCLKTIWIVMRIMHFIYTLVDVYNTNCKVSESWMLCHALNRPWSRLNKFFWILWSTLIKIQANKTYEPNYTFFFLGQLQAKQRVELGIHVHHS